MHPVLETPFGDILAYTLFLFVGFVAAACLTWWLHRDRGFHFETVFALTVVAAASGLVGARAWYVATHPRTYAAWFRAFASGGMDLCAGGIVAAVTAVLLLLFARESVRLFPRFAAASLLLALSGIAGLLGARVAALHQTVPEADPFSPEGGGLAFFGGLALATLACAVTARRYGIPAADAADAVAPGVLLACSIGRIGCFLNGCCAGFAASGPLAPGGHVPTQLMESVATLGLSAWAAWRPSPAPGHIAAFVAFAYAALRFYLDSLRADVSPALLGLTPSQLASLVLAAVALVLFYRTATTSRRPA